MSHAFQTVLWMLLQFFAPRHNAQIRFLKAQIEILRRRLPGERIVPRPAEKAELLRIGSEFGQEVKPVLEIVRPETYRRWVNDAKRGKRPKKSGRPRLNRELRDLVVRMGKDNFLWGYRRIVGELKKLGHVIGRTSGHISRKDPGRTPMFMQCSAACISLNIASGPAASRKTQ